MIQVPYFQYNEEAKSKVFQDYEKEYEDLLAQNIDKKEFKRELNQLKKKTAANVMKAAYEGVPRWKIVVSVLFPPTLFFLVLGIIISSYFKS